MQPVRGQLRTGGAEYSMADTDHGVMDKMNCSAR